MFVHGKCITHSLRTCCLCFQNCIVECQTGYLNPKIGINIGKKEGFMAVWRGLNPDLNLWPSSYNTPIA
jgi:hypothetical protein